jgi:5,10-methylenetetrahydromethanopterin reductase
VNILPQIVGISFSCGLAPGIDTPELAVLAESCGYERVWLWESPAVYGELWMTLARVAERTRTAKIGPGLTVTSLRHVMVTASAIATLEQLAPGRTAVAVGTGFSSRILLGQKPMRWADVERDVRQLRALLRGEEVDVNGRRVQMLHQQPYAPQRPIRVPIVIAANGPKGLRVARELGDGVMSVKEPIPGFDWSIVAGSGTVLDPGERANDPRVLAAVGPYLTMLYHYFYDIPTTVDVGSLPSWKTWQMRVDAIPDDVRHLELHRSHMVGIDERDKALVSGEAVMALTWTGTPAEVRERFKRYAAGGATEIYYEPTGPDLEREIVTFARAVGITG